MNVVLYQLKMAGLNTAFMESMAVYESAWQSAMLFVPSTVASENYGWLGDVAGLEEWKDELVPRGLTEFGYSLPNKRFGDAIKLYNDDLSDERYGQSKIRVADMAEKAKAFPGQLLSQLRVNGQTALCYDGQTFYSTTHVEGLSGTQGNLVTGTGTTVAQATADFKSAYGKMFTFVTDKGDPFVRGNVRLVAVCGPLMFLTLKEALLLTTVSAGGQNVMAGLVSEIVVDQRITDNDWYLEDWGPKMKPFVLQEREPVTTANTGLESDTYVLSDATVFRAKWRGNAGYGQWRNSIKINN